MFAWQPSDRRARWHEWLVYGLNRPLAWAVLEGSRRLGPVVHVPGIGTIISDADVARHVLTDTMHFDSHSFNSLGFLVTQVLGPFALLNMDGEEHRALKRMLIDVFSPRYVDSLLRPAAGDLCNKFSTALRAGDEQDLVAFMARFAGAMACELMGLCVEQTDADERYLEVFRLATEFTAFAGLGKRRLPPDQLRRAKAVAGRLADLVRASYESGSPRETSLVHRMRALGYSFEQVRGVVVITMVGATELITYGIPRIVALLLDSGQMALLKARPALLDQAVDEGLRYVTPSNVIFRAVVTDCAVRGYRFRAGTRTLVVFHNIMHRNATIGDANRFDITRGHDASIRRLMFGAGPHTCLGTGLAVAETRAVLSLLVALDGVLTITGRRYNRAKTYPGYSSLRVRLRPSSSAGFRRTAAT